MGIGLVYPKFAAHHNHLLLLQIEFIHFSLYKVNIGCPPFRFLRLNKFNLRPEQKGETKMDVLDRFLRKAFAADE